MGALSLSGILGSFSWPWITPLLPSHAAAWAPTEGCGDGGPEEGPSPASPFVVSLSLPQQAGPQGQVGLPPTQL